jgi:hypothetical protein
MMLFDGCWTMGQLRRLCTMMPYLQTEPYKFTETAKKERHVV